MTRDGDGRPLRVLSYNVRRARGMDGRRDLGRVADVVRRIDPDLVGLQEVDRNRERSGFVDQAGRLADSLGMESVFEATDVRDEGRDDPGEYGIAALSAGSIRRVDAHPLPDDPDAEPRVLLETRTEVDDASVGFGVTHLALDEALRRRQAAAVADAATADPGVVVGDFNAVPGSDPVDAVTERFTDAFAEAGMDDVPTFPSPYARRESGGRVAVRAPQRRIDYVFCSPGVEVVGADRHESLASDHCAVVADLRVDA